jgi:hypothetical protein
MLSPSLAFGSLGVCVLTYTFVKVEGLLLQRSECLCVTGGNIYRVRQRERSAVLLHTTSTTCCAACCTTAVN